MNGIVLIIPLLLIRFGLLGLIYKPALSRAAFFAPLMGGEKVAYVLYQISNIFLILYLLFLKIQMTLPFLITGLTIYTLGIVVLIISTSAFAKPNEGGLNTNGIYRISRNPMYIGYFLYYSGCVVLTHSVLLLIALVIFQVSTHWIILSEERWCIDNFGEEYSLYMKRTRRYL